MKFLKHTWLRVSGWWGRRRLRTKLGIILLVVIALMVVLGNRKSEPVIETVTKQDLARTVSATGTVVSTTDLSLSFQQNGTVSSVRVAVGDKVVKGQVLATLSAGDEYASLTSAQGALLAAQARERKVSEGSSDEAVRKVTIALENARRTLYSEDLVARYEDNTTDAARDPRIAGVYRGTTEGTYRVSFESSVNQVRYSGLEQGTVTVSKAPVPLGTKGLTIAFPANKSQYSVGDSWEIDIPNTSGASYAANLNAYRTAEAELEEVKANARSADVDVAHADVVSAQGGVQAAQAAVEKTIVRAPASGTVTKVDIKLGDLAESFDPVITVQDIEHLYIEADVNESDVSNIQVDQPITITYDAFGKSTSYSAAVTSIDLAPTVVDGIVNYKLNAQIERSDTIRPGMTANLSIQTAFVPNVLVIPERVIKDGNTVTVIDAEGNEEIRTVTLGLRGDGGLVEVTSGLSEGEQVLFQQ
jgi:multidrug efflux pump subunit AcrA (membrane-fusion protein)